MKKETLKRIVKISAVSLLVPHIVYGYDLFKPKIENKGQYMLQLTSGKKLRPLYGHVPVDVNESTQVRPLMQDKILKLSIILALNNEKQLDEKLLSITNPNRPDYQHFLSQSEFIAQYSPTLEQVNKVNDFLTKNGMNVESISSNRLIIRASGSVGAIEKIFNTKLYNYTDKMGKSYYAPAYELQIDRTLNITSVQGLENRIKAHPNYRVLKSANASKSAGPIGGLSPANIKTAYSLSSNLNGSGQNLALLELDGYTASDVNAYEKEFNLPQVPLQNILVDGATGTPSSGKGPGEVTLDIELMAALAPGASKILVYEGPNSGSGLVDTFNRIATDNLSKSISTSWGISESEAGSVAQSENPIFKQMIAQGQILYAAAGDSGAYDDGQKLGVDDPSSQPFVVAVGGTKLLTNTNGSYKSETTWATGNGPGGQGGGGGISSLWSIPQWQQGVVSSDSLGSTTMRNTPDVSLNADPSTGYSIFYKGQWTIYGGTSCAAPLWAAFTALVNQERSNNGQTTLGFPNPTIYALGQSSNYASTFHDIADHSTNLHYPAVTGYDLATGWGTFIGDALINSLAGGSSPPTPVCTQANPTVSISPTSQTSTAGGTLSYNMTVTNNDSSACSASNFNLTATTPSGFTDSLSQNSLNIAAGASQTASIKVTSASSVASGNYSFSVNAINAGASNYHATGSATYSVMSQNQLNLTISPQNGTFPYNSGQYATFNFALMKGTNPLPGSLIFVDFAGPTKWSTIVLTQLNGIAQYYLFLNHSIPQGSYSITATSSYNGNTIVGKDNFSIM